MKNTKETISRRRRYTGVITADQTLDIYKLVGLETLELLFLSDDFLDSLAHKDRPNLQAGLLRRLINDQIKTVPRSNIVQARKFSEQLKEAINRYTNCTLTTAEIIVELVKLAKEMGDDAKRHEALGLRRRDSLLRRRCAERRGGARNGRRDLEDDPRAVESSSLKCND